MEQVTLKNIFCSDKFFIFIEIFFSGAYGTVYKARDKRVDSFVAMKKVRIAMTEDGVPANVLREISLLRHLGKYNHPNIVRLLDICPGPKYDKVMELYLIFEHVEQVERLIINND